LLALSSSLSSSSSSSPPPALSRRGIFYSHPESVVVVLLLFCVGGVFGHKPSLPVPASAIGTDDFRVLLQVPAFPNECTSHMSFTARSNALSRAPPITATKTNELAQKQYVTERSRSAKTITYCFISEG
jgi:hypothetical protein